MLSVYQSAGRVDGGVEHHPAHPVGEQRPVDLAEIGAVGEPVVIDLRHAECLADLVHVAGHIDGRHIGQQPAEPLLAPGRVGLGPADEHLLGRRAGRDVVGPHLVEETRVAAQRGHRTAHPARVEADDVVGGRHLRAQPGRDRGRERPAGLARSPRVDEQHALLPGGRRGGRDHRQRQRDLPAAGIGVVQRHRQRCALRARQRPPHWLQCSVDAFGTTAAVPAPSPPSRCRRRPSRCRWRRSCRSRPPRRKSRAAGPDVQALRPAPTASATAASARQRRSGRSFGEGETGMPSILPHRGDSLRHGSPSIRHVAPSVRYLSLQVGFLHNEIRHNTHITEFFLAFRVNFRHSVS